MKSMLSLAAAFTFAAGTASAVTTTVVDVGHATYYRTDSFNYYVEMSQTRFSTAGGLTTIDILGSGWTGGPSGAGNGDPYLYLFRDDGSLDAADFVAQDDDGGLGSDGSTSWLDSYLSLSLAAGDYIAMVGYCCDGFSGADATDAGVLQGYQNLSDFAWLSEPRTVYISGDHQVTITGEDIVLNASAVPLPATLPLLGAAFVAAAAASRRRRAEA